MHRTVLLTLRIAMAWAAGLLAGAAMAEATFPQPIPLADVKVQGWLGQRLQRAAGRIEALGKQDRMFQDLEKDGDWGADYAGRWLEAGCLLRRCSAGDFNLTATLTRLLRYQQPTGNFKGTFPGALDKKLSFWGDHRALIALAVLAREDHNPTALEAGRKLADFYVGRTAAKDWEKLNGIPGGTASALEGMVAFYELTGNKAYLQAGIAMADYVTSGVKHPKGHSHSLLTTLRGMADLYRVTGEPRFIETCQYVAKLASTEHEYVSGGIPETFPDDGDGDETCSTADWLRLQMQLWTLTGDSAYRDAAERIALNHLLYAQMPNGGFVGFRNLTGRVGEEWDFCCSFHGCLALMRLAENIYATGKADGGRPELHVNFMIPSEATVRFADGTACRVAQQTDYPREGRTTLTIHTGSPFMGRVLFHLPSFAFADAQTIKVQVNEKAATPTRDPATLTFEAPEQGWREGDRIQIEFPMHVRAQRRAPWETRREEACFWYGPVLLARTETESDGYPFRLTASQQQYRHMELDCSVQTRTPLKIGARTYAHGLGAHAYSVITLALGKDCKGFKADVGIDNNADTQGKLGSAVFVVRADGKTCARSDVRRGGMEPLALAVDFDHATSMTLAVEDGGDGIGFDQADWANARIILHDGREVGISEEIQRQMAGPEVTRATVNAPEKAFTRHGSLANDFGFTFRAEGTVEGTPARITFMPLASADPSRSSFGVWNRVR